MDPTDFRGWVMVITVRKAAVPSCDCAGGTNGVKVYFVEFPGWEVEVLLFSNCRFDRESCVAKRRDGWGGARRGEEEPSPVGGV